MSGFKRYSLVLANLLALTAGAAFAGVKIGLSGALSGPVAAVGQDQVDGFMLALEQLGSKRGGQTATVFKEDETSDASPETSTVAGGMTSTMPFAFLTHVDHSEAVAKMLSMRRSKVTARDFHAYHIPG